MRTIKIASSQHENILILNEEDFNIELFSDAKLTLKFFISNSIKNIKIYAKLFKNAQIDIIFADFSDSSCDVDCLIDLEEDYSKANVHLASLNYLDFFKKFTISFNHHAPNTFSKMDLFGVCKDASKIVFTGTSKIFNGSYKSNAQQNAKIIVFDEKAFGETMPLLKIDDNDVIATHSAVVGRLKDDHLFYLMSRGLSRKDARTLITYGYLSPISKYFDDTLQKEINDIIASRV